MESQQLLKDNQLLEREDISMSPSEQTLVETDGIPDGTWEKGCVSQILYMDLAGPLPTTKDDYKYILDNLKPFRQTPENIWEVQKKKEEILNRNLDDEVVEPQVEIQHSQETANEVIYPKRIPDAVRDDTTGGCQHAEVRSSVREYRLTLEVNLEGTEDQGKVKENDPETSAGDVEGEARLAHSMRPSSQAESHIKEGRRDKVWTQI